MTKLPISASVKLEVKTELPSDASGRLAHVAADAVTADREHKVTLPSDCQIEPPRLGKVGDVALYMNRRLEFVPIQTPEEPESKLVAHDTDRAVPRTQASAPDTQALQTLQSLKRAAWLAVGILALIFIFLFLRR